ncbi:hypothetical protein [Alicyclobacillus shizuokensis]|uniref:hypothetical protein n=1 Tax=Alicyclobacillus shizuokensis TaxID=392014 RepID=UPI00083090D0|nr:hypothetical protein [Alicyclobacillus shizuokensis]MCL6625457.1 hypothetical protein [Alicyclobacillus shizuokensis]
MSQTARIDMIRALCDAHGASGYPTRYIHSHAAVYPQQDFDHGVALLVELVKRLARRQWN